MSIIVRACALGVALYGLSRLVMKPTHDLMQKVERETKLDSPYSISIPLLGAANLKNRPLYEKYQNAILHAFPSIETSEHAWILARLMIANLRMDDHDSAQKYASVIEQILQKSQVDPFSAWTWGYLAIYFAKVRKGDYHMIKAKMLNCTDALMQKLEEKGKDNVPWAIVMELQSLAEMEDVSYYQRLEKLKEFTGTGSVVQALETIPPNDFRAWAVSLVLSAAKKMNDHALVHDLTEYLPKAMDLSPSDADKMLALSEN